MFCNGIADYRKSYIEPAGWQCLFPLLGENSSMLAVEIIQRGIKAFICTVDTHQLDGQYIGQSFDNNFLEKLPADIDACGENGEFHTFVYDASFLKNPLVVTFDTVNSDSRFHFQEYKLPNMSD